MHIHIIILFPVFLTIGAKGWFTRKIFNLNTYNVNDKKLRAKFSHSFIQRFVGLVGILHFVMKE